MTAIEIGALILGSNIALELVKQFFTRNHTTAGTIKLKNEAGQIVLEGELKITEFYKEQLEAILAKYTALEEKFEVKYQETEMYKEKLVELESKHAQLQRDFTLLKTQVTGKD
jgi:predicted nuclease with TOPRIM domain